MSSASLSKLEKLGFIQSAREFPTQLTPYGENSIASILQAEIPTSKVNNVEFEEFWKAFPASDKHGNYPNSRKIRSNKPETFKAWNKVLAEGNTHEEILSALKAEVHDRKHSSSIKNGNALKYMKGSVKWLESHAFLDYLDAEPDEEPTYGAGFE